MKNILLLAILGLSLACHSGSKTTSQKVTTEQNWTYEEGKASAILNKLIAELKSDTEGSSLNTYVPSENDRKKYGIKKMDGKYYIGGIVKVSDSYKMADFDAYLVKTATTAGNILTVLVPLTEIVNLLNSPELVYFDMNNSIKTR